MKPQLVIDRLGRQRGLLLALMLIAIVAAADYATGYAVRLSVFYLVPIALATWTAGTTIGAATAALSSALWLLSFRSEHFYLHQGYYLWEAVGMLTSFVAFAWLIARLQQALSQADERFFRLLEEIRATVYVVDENRDEIVYANSEMARLVGDPAAMKPRDFEQQFVRDADSIASGGAHPAGMEGGFSSGTIRNQLTGHWYLMQKGPIPWGSNSNVRLNVLTDITTHKNIELLREKHIEIMHQAAKLATLAEMATTLGHEINQPLMVIATYTDACQRLLEADDIDRGEIAGALRKCHTQAVRASAIIERLREFIRQRQYLPIPCDARAVVLDAIDIMRPLIEETRAIVDSTRVPPGIEIVADRILLTQVLVNLIRNAIEAMSGMAVNARKVSITVEAQDSGKVVFSVADHGHGLATNAMERIFSPFFTTKADGLGLGLAICRNVAEAHGGQVWASGNQGGGAIFFVAIPARRVQ